MKVHLLRLAGLLFSVVVMACAHAQPAGDPLASPGPYGAGWRTVTVTRTGGSSFTARLHYPSQAGTAGENAVFDGSGGPYPAISFGHGFLQAVTQYQSTCAHLATHGFFVIASTSEGGLAPSHAAFAADLRECLTWLEEQNADPVSPYFGVVDVDAIGLSGHSMGGGCSILAAAADARVKCLANLAAAETNPSAVAAIAGVRCPVFLIAGSQDSIVPVGTNGQRMYDAASPGTGRQLPIITGGFHCGFTDNTFLFCDSGAITRDEQLATTRRLLTAFFKLHLRKDSSLWREVWGPDAPPGIDPTGVTLASAPGFAMSVAPNMVEAAPGGPANIDVTVINPGGGPASFRIEVERETGEGGWTGGFAELTDVPAGGQAFATIVARAPGLAGPNADRLLISVRSLSGGDPRAWTLREATRRACIADWNGLAGVTVQDLFDFLRDYFSASADFNGVGGTTVQDIFDFLAAYFDTCG
jgi:dienelactone hydrolase